jgi:hypothetical protein
MADGIKVGSAFRTALVDAAKEDPKLDAATLKALLSAPTVEDWQDARQLADRVTEDLEDQALQDKADLKVPGAWTQPGAADKRREELKFRGLSERLSIATSIQQLVNELRPQLDGLSPGLADRLTEAPTAKDAELVRQLVPQVDEAKNHRAQAQLLATVVAEATDQDAR